MITSREEEKGVSALVFLEDILHRLIGGESLMGFDPSKLVYVFFHQLQLYQSLFGLPLVVTMS